MRLHNAIFLILLMPFCAVSQNYYRFEVSMMADETNKVFWNQGAFVHQLLTLTDSGTVAAFAHPHPDSTRRLSPAEFRSAMEMINEMDGFDGYYQPEELELNLIEYYLPGKVLKKRCLEINIRPYAMMKSPTQRVGVFDLKELEGKFNGSAEQKRWHNPWNYLDSLSWVEAIIQKKFVPDCIAVIEGENNIYVKCRKFDIPIGAPEDAGEFADMIRALDKDRAPARKDTLVKYFLHTNINLQSDANRPYFAYDREISKILIEAVMQGKIQAYKLDGFINEDKLSWDDFKNRLRRDYESDDPDNPQEPLLYNGRDLSRIMLVEQYITGVDAERKKYVKRYDPDYICLIAPHEITIEGGDIFLAYFKMADCQKLFTSDSRAVWYNPGNHADSLDFGKAISQRLYEPDYYYVRTSSTHSYNIDKFYPDSAIVNPKESYDKFNRRMLDELVSDFFEKRKSPPDFLAARKPVKGFILKLQVHKMIDMRNPSNATLMAKNETNPANILLNAMKEGSIKIYDQDGRELNPEYAVMKLAYQPEDYDVPYSEWEDEDFNNLILVSDVVVNAKGKKKTTPKYIAVASMKEEFDLRSAYFRYDDFVKLMQEKSSSDKQNDYSAYTKLEAMQGRITHIEDINDLYIMDIATATKSEYLTIIPQYLSEYIPAEGFCILKDTVYGFVDHEGRQIISPQYDLPFSFNEAGAALVRRAGLWGLIGITGNIILPLEYEKYSRTTSGYSFTKNYKVLETDRQGKIIRPLVFKKDEYSFTEGMAKVFKKGRYGFVNEQGDLIVPEIHCEVGDFENGVAIVKKEYRQCALIDKTGRNLTEYKYDFISDFESGLAVVSLNESEYYGAINRKGEQVLPCEYVSITIDTGVVRVVSDYQEILMDTTGRELSRKISNYGWAMLSDGYAIIKKGNAYGKYLIIDAKGNIVSEEFYSPEVGSFHEGLAFALKDGLYGFINPQGKFVIEPQFTHILEDFKNGVAKVKKIDKTFYIDRKGKQVK